MTLSSLILERSNTPSTFLDYSFQNAIQDRHPDQTVTVSETWLFNFQKYAAAGQAQLKIPDDQRSSTKLSWHESKTGVIEEHESVVFEIEWRERSVLIYRISWATSCGHERLHFIVTDCKKVAIDFVGAVCEWCQQLKGVVWSFSDGYWSQSASLFQSVKKTDFRTLILPDGFGESIISDFQMFLNSRQRYQKYGVPWKRGVIFTGPPGNGKTHFVRALVNELDLPCYYVKSFDTESKMESHGIKEVYEFVRSNRPAVLVLEDLDSLINEKNRSFFLNELDGFEDNDGMITIATTNYPEKLDRAILERPSRFDRKWHFSLPAMAERKTYFASWNQHLPRDERLGDEQLQSLANDTDRFSFAYLKEMCLGGVLQWVQSDQRGPLFESMVQYRKELVSQSNLLNAAG